MSLLQGKGEYYYFAVYDEVTHDLLYTGLNFLFEDYRIDRGLPPTTSKTDIYYEFLVENNSTLDKPFFVKDDLKKYFGVLTPEMLSHFNSVGFSALFYMMGASPDGYYTMEFLIENQFNIVEVNDNWRRLQDYIFREPTGKFYSKFNFDFDQWTVDFNSWGNKLCMFTDYIIRNLFLSGQVYGFYGYGFPIETFKKYFKDSIDVKDYILAYGVTSVYKIAYKNLYNIDFIEYGKVNLDLEIYNGNEVLLKEHFYKYGQFEKRIIPFKRPIDPKTKYFKTLTLVDAGVEYGSGFLYSGGQDFQVVGGKNQLFIVTCYHLIANNSNKNILRASIDFKTNPFNITDSETIQMEFRVIGYDIYTDIVVGLYDPFLDFNKIFNPDLDVSEIYALNLDVQTVLQLGQDVLTITNLSNIDNFSYLQGRLIDQNYAGNFVDSSFMGAPSSLLINFFSQQGASGSPVFIELPSGDLQIVGMITGIIGSNNQYTIGLANFLLTQVVYNICARWFGFVLDYINDPAVLNYFIRDGWPKRWLGIKFSYFSPVFTPKKYSAFSNLGYSGGLVVEDFIIGFNKTTREFIYDFLDLQKLDSLVLNTPLLKTEMYRKFINSSRRPILIKSILFYDNFTSQTAKFYFGKFGNQVSYNIITYNMITCESTLNEKKYTNRVLRHYNTIEIEYYYYNGRDWVLSNELIGANTPDWYNEYSDPLGNLYKEHKFDFPSILIPYLKPYLDLTDNFDSQKISEDVMMTPEKSINIFSGGSINPPGNQKSVFSGGSINPPGNQKSVF